MLRNPRRRAAPWCAALALLIAPGTRAHAHSGHGDAQPSPTPPLLAPGWSPLEFTPAVPGTYALPPLGIARDAEVLASDGHPTALHALFDGRVVVLSFVYASCADPNGCPLASAVLRGLATRLAGEPALRDEVRLLTLSIDPSSDTPPVMEAYGRGLRVEGINWRFLTTRSEAALAPILEAYDQSVTRQTDQDGKPVGISHVLRVYLIDQKRRVRNIYSASFLHADTLFADVQTLRLEASAAARDGRAAADAGAASHRELRGPGDDKAGYERADYRTHARDLTARRGRPADLLALARRPRLGLPPVPVPAESPLTAAAIALGRTLFFDRRLSRNGTLSCAMCHIPEQGFTSNELATPVGIEGRTVRRNAPTLYDVAYARHLFHDARETRLEQQIWGPLLAPDEMGNASASAVIEAIRALPDYAGAFQAAFGRSPDAETLGRAVASYERTLVSGDSPFDRWRFGHAEDAVSPSAQRGFRLFSGRAACVGCHVVAADHALFTDDGLHDTGIGWIASTRQDAARLAVQVAPGVVLDVGRDALAAGAARPSDDLGRFEITRDPGDRWRYRTPTLRNVALTAPYMHDGSLRTLGEVVEYYDRGGAAHEGLDPRIRPLGLSAGDKADLVAFLEALTGDGVDALVADAFGAPVGNAGGGDRDSASPGPRD